MTKIEVLEDYLEAARYSKSVSRKSENERVNIDERIALVIEIIEILKKADKEVEVQSQLNYDIVKEWGLSLEEANERLRQSKLRVREYCRGNINSR